MLGALTNAEVCGLIADPGGQYAYFRRMYGKFFAFLFGWSSFTVIQSATIASVAYVFAQSINTLVSLPRFSAEVEAMMLFDTFAGLFMVENIVFLGAPDLQQQYQGGHGGQ